MSNPDRDRNLPWWRNRSTTARLGLLALTSIFAFAALALPIALRPEYYPLRVGEVSSQDIQAQSSLSYVSEVLTEQARKAAENSVSPIYLPADTSITRQQIETLRLALDYISNIRLDPYATEEQKINDLLLLEDLPLSKESASQIINLTDTGWQNVSDESMSVLEQVMRTTIREDKIIEAKRNIPSLISFSLPQVQASLVSEIVSAFVIPNSLYSAELTNEARQEARNQVEPLTRSFIAGEAIVLRGQIITPEAMEALQAFNLIQPESSLQNLLSTAALVLSFAIFTGLYFNRRKTSPFHDIRSLAMVSVVFLIFLFGARFIIPNRAVLPYLYPIPAFALTIATLFNLEVSIIFSLSLSVLSAYSLTNSLDLTIFYFISSLFGVLILGKGRRVANFFWAGLAIGLAGSAVIVSYRLNDAVTDWLGIATLVGGAFLNGLASASITLIIQFLFAQLLGLTTAMQLLDLSRPDHPLLQFLLQNAPGTYQHSLQVANLAEQAAETIGADALLTRVGCLYHDVGKAINPLFFVENQIAGNVNPHDDLDPTSSAATIIRHVEDGIQVSKKYHIPPRIQDFVREHHGTLITRYQYAQAVQANGGKVEGVDKDSFRYPGPAPRSRETAILMLADGYEARARAEVPKTEADLQALVKKVIDFCEHEGQLDNTTLTLRDLHRISESFVKTLQNTYHPRLQYPEVKTTSASPEKTRPNEILPNAGGES